MNNNKYDDIINLPHHVSKKHPQMSIYQRSAQFAPFAALNDYGDEVYEASRITRERIELDDEVKIKLSNKLNRIKEKIKYKPRATFTYFIPDTKKDGGKYVTISENIIKIDEYNKNIILENKTQIKINDIIDIVLDEN